MSHILTRLFWQPLTQSVLTVAGAHGGDHDEKITLHGLRLQVAQGELLGICGEVRPTKFLASFLQHCALCFPALIRTSRASVGPTLDPNHPSCIFSGPIVDLFSPQLFPCVSNCCV